MNDLAYSSKQYMCSMIISCELFGSVKETKARTNRMTKDPKIVNWSLMES